MDEYPKVIRVGGVSVTVRDAADEARWVKTGPSAVPAPASAPTPPLTGEDTGDETAGDDPLEDVTVEMDDPSFAAPKKKTPKKK